MLHDFPKHERATYWLAKSLYAEGEFMQSITLLDALLRRNPSDPYIQHENAECLRKLKKYNAAISLFQSVLASLGDLDQKLKRDVLNGLAYCYLELMRAEKRTSQKNKYAQLALRFFNNLTADESIQSPRAHCGLGFLYLAMASDDPDGPQVNHTKARAQFEKALALDPRNKKAKRALEELTQPAPR
jgi:tetratricopeptide (TPR) repeat protein